MGNKKTFQPLVWVQTLFRVAEGLGWWQLAVPQAEGLVDLLSRLRVCAFWR